MKRLISSVAGPISKKDRPRCFPGNHKLLPHSKPPASGDGPTKIGELLGIEREKTEDDELGFDVVEVMPKDWKMVYEYLRHQMPIINPLDFRAIDRWRWEEKIDSSWMLYAMRQTFDRPKGRPDRPIPYLLTILKKKKEEGCNLQEPMKNPPSYGQKQSLAAFKRKESPGESSGRVNPKKERNPGLSNELDLNQTDRKGG